MSSDVFTSAGDVPARDAAWLALSAVVMLAFAAVVIAGLELHVRRSDQRLRDARKLLKTRDGQLDGALEALHKERTSNAAGEPAGEPPAGAGPA